MVLLIFVLIRDIYTNWFVHFIFFDSSIIKSFQKIYMSYFVISCIIVRSTSIILYILDNIDNLIEFKIVKHIDIILNKFSDVTWIQSSVS